MIDHQGSWQTKFAAALQARRGTSRDAAERLVAAFPPGYAELTSPEEAADDLEELAYLEAAVREAAKAPDEPSAAGVALVGPAYGGLQRLAVRPAPEPGAGPNAFRLRRFGVHSIELTAFLPVLESFGLVVSEAVPFRMPPLGDHGFAAHVDDFSVRLVPPAGAPDTSFVLSADGPRLVAALSAAASGYCDVDSLNRLVTFAGFGWTQAMVLRAYRRYRHQTTALTDRQLDDPLAAYPQVARPLIEYFEARFDPANADPDKAAEARSRALSALDTVPNLEEDRVLRGYLALVGATLRTSYFRPDGLAAAAERAPSADLPAPTVTLKLDSSRVPELAAPRPRVEAWVHGPEVEGLHLRAGLIARGGIRWSERNDDFRTEILDLAMAQVKKNAIIVPTGAKGGFVCRRAGAGPTEVRAAYAAFISALIDITDNLVAGDVVSPNGVAAYDGPDPYLVVAADKGTATFSDLANSLSEARRFWLGDAFASGGSRGYDHKAMGITARGAWVAVRRHFHQLGMDVQADPLRVVGVGDMSGDVFGNGMLQSRSLRLLAAFDHRHIFVDPDPDPDASFEERRRLAGLGRSSWADYRPELISPGGAVWARNEKRLAISAQAQAALGITETEMSPPELISAILAAPVDLLWFGGIGTYIKSPEESDATVGDHANDAVRITSDRVRARVIAEGGNLGVTQQARIRYSRRGGRINADFIDNAAGVATSDREVNLKILLALAMDEGALDQARRDALLAECQNEVAAAVLRQVDHSAAALSRGVPASADQLDAYAALIEALEEAGDLDRAVEGLPSPKELDIRRGAGAGLIRPELAVVLAYAKSHLVAAIEASPLAAEPAFEEAVAPYFPEPVRHSFGHLVRRHRLYPQLLATNVAGELVDHMGAIWAQETAAELGRPLPDVAAAFWAARQVLDAGPLWDDIEHRSAALGADAEHQLHELVAGAVSSLARSYLRRAGPIDAGKLVGHDRPLAAAIAAARGPENPADRPAIDTLAALGVERELAAHYVGRTSIARLGDASEVARALNRPLADVIAALSGIDDASGAGRLGALISQAPVRGRWASWQRRALLDDMEAWRRAAVTEALSTMPGVPPGAAVGAWAAPRAQALAHTARLLAQLDPEKGDALTLAALVLRDLRRTATTGLDPGSGPAAA